MQVLLFDIDGTLIRSGGAGKAAMETGLTNAFGIKEVHDGVSYSGRTDPSLSSELLSLHGIEPTPENLNRHREAYLACLPDCLKKSPGEVLPGVAELLARLHDRAKFAVGLLTGNIQRGAELKLRHHELWNMFAFGGFADGIFDRDDVARHALTVARNHLQKEIQPESVWVIGDTPLDVKCARAIGAKVIAVATGWHGLEELSQTTPELVVEDLSNPEPLFQVWGV